MLDQVNVKYPYGQRPQTKAMKQTDRAKHERENRLCARNKKLHDAFIANPDDFYVRPAVRGVRKAACAKKSLNKFGRRALSLGLYLQGKKVKAEANALARDGKVIAEGQKVDKVCEFSGDYRGAAKAPRVGQCLKVTGAIRLANRAKDKTIRGVTYQGQGKGKCVPKGEGWVCTGNFTGQINSIAKYVNDNQKVNTFPEAEKIMREAFAFTKMVIPQKPINVTPKPKAVRKGKNKKD